MSLDVKINGDLVTKSERASFERRAAKAFDTGMTKRETAFFLSTDAEEPPPKSEIKAFREKESFGLHKGLSVCPVLEAGKANIESGHAGSILSGHTRRVTYLHDMSFLSPWEGTAYWDCFPAWYTKIVLHFHPRYRSQKGVL